MIDTLTEALDFAIAKEKEAEAFYTEWAGKAKNSAVQKLFTELAATERGHAETLERVVPEELIAEDAGDRTDLNLSELLVDVEAREGMSVQEAMIVAMKREEGAEALYDRLAGLGGAAGALFKRLAVEESEHKRRLEAEYDEHILTEN